MEVIILPDNDEPGQHYADDVAAILSKLVPAARVRELNLPNLPEGGDMVDWIDAHGEAAEPNELRREIDALADAADVVEGVPDAADEPYVQPMMTRLSDVQPEAVRWLWSSVSQSAS